MNTYYYLLEANAYLLGFYAFYRLVLQNETFYSFNRFYLLGTSIIAFIMPSIRISGLHTLPVEYVSSPMGETISAWTPADTGIVIYLVVSACFLLRLGSRLYQVSQLILKGSIKTDKGIKIVAIDDKNYSFSFMNYLFIHPAVQKAETIIRHEQVHIRQLHSIDILFFELLQIVNWFNPLITWIQKDIRALHEFIADEETSQYESNAGDYALFLIHHSYGAQPNDLGSSMFSQSLLKKRIMKLHQKKSPAGARLKYMLVLLLLPLMLCIIAATFAKSYGIVDLMPSKAMIQDTIKRRPPPPPPPPPPSGITKSGNITGENKPPPPPPPPPPAPKVQEIRFPPPVVVPAKAVKPGYEKKGALPSNPPKSKVVEIRFPPPVVVRKAGKPGGAKEVVLVSKSPAPKVQEIRFPPPVVVPAKAAKPGEAKKGALLSNPPKPKVVEIRFPPPVVVPAKAIKAGDAEENKPPPPPPPPPPTVKEVTEEYIGPNK